MSHHDQIQCASISTHKVRTHRLTPFTPSISAKNYQLGWYSDKYIQVDPSSLSSAWYGSLAAFTHYDSVDSSEYVVIRVGNFFVQYNYQTGINAETQEHQNSITIVEYDETADDTGTGALPGYSASTEAGQLQNAGDSYTTSDGYVIELCGTITSLLSGAPTGLLSIRTSSQTSQCDLISYGKKGESCDTACAADGLSCEDNWHAAMTTSTYTSGSMTAAMKNVFGVTCDIEDANRDNKSVPKVRVASVSILNVKIRTCYPSTTDNSNTSCDKEPSDDDRRICGCHT